MSEEEITKLVDHIWLNVVTGIEKSLYLTGIEAKTIAEALEYYRDNH